MIQKMRIVLGTLGLLAILTACSSASQTNQKSINYSKVVDLSHVIDTNIPLWPGDPPVVFETVAEFATDGYYLRRFSMGEHSGTHMNAANSFHENGTGIDAYTPESLVVPAVVIDIRAQTADNPDYALTKDDVLAWEKEHGKIPAGSVVLLYTGWQEKWNDPKAFFNEDADGGLHFPGFDGATTRFLLDERKIAGVGIDTHGADPGQDTSYATNTQVTEVNGIVLECVTNLDQLPPTGTTLVLGILRLKDGSGTPLSVMAFVP
ncbi:MAG: cyclase [Anaerolineae bacterium CG03_land_8_20_14_0_80_58_20]|nr:MAG: cyclase [Anaerolineae bacterium CG03_land_8_20_14_0_80_58_20]